VFQNLYGKLSMLCSILNHLSTNQLFLHQIILLYHDIRVIIRYFFNSGFFEKKFGGIHHFHSFYASYLFCYEKVSYKKIFGLILLSNMDLEVKIVIRP